MLYQLCSETPFLTGPKGRKYSCLVIRKKGLKPRANIETLCFETGLSPRIMSEEGIEITHEIDCATFGQQIVRDGKVIDLDTLIQDARASKWYDLRQLILFPRIPRRSQEQQRWIDGGLASFWDQQGALDEGAVEAALLGRVRVVDVAQFLRDGSDVASAMQQKGYKEVSNPQLAGEYRLDGAILRVVFLPGIYPHSMVGIREDGKLLWVGVKGLSNRAGVTVIGAAEVMKRLGAVQALVVDNGGDVRLDIGGQTFLPSAEGRNRFRSLLILRSDGPGTVSLGDHLRLSIEVQFPRA